MEKILLVQQNTHKAEKRRGRTGDITDCRVVCDGEEPFGTAEWTEQQNNWDIMQITR